MRNGKPIFPHPQYTPPIQKMMVFQFLPNFTTGNPSIQTINDVNSVISLMTARETTLFSYHSLLLCNGKIGFEFAIRGTPFLFIGKVRFQSAFRCCLHCTHRASNHPLHHHQPPPTISLLRCYGDRVQRPFPDCYDH